jgi:hypothetical protein
VWQLRTDATQEDPVGFKDNVKGKAEDGLDGLDGKNDEIR